VARLDDVGHLRHLGTGRHRPDQSGREGGARVAVPAETVVAPPPEDETAMQRAFVLAYRTLARVSRAMPEKTGTAVARRLGRLSYRLSSKARLVVAANQAQVLGRPVDDPLVVASTREAFELYARYFVESFPLPELSDEEIVARVDCDTEYRLHEAAAAGKGGICALPHLGNWDAAGRWMKAIATLAPAGAR